MVATGSDCRHCGAHRTPRPVGAPMLASTLLSIFLLTELSQYARPFIQGERVPDLRQIDTLFNREQIDRVVTNCDGVLQPNDMAQLSTPTVNGYNSVFLQSYSAFTYSPTPRSHI